MPASRVRRRLIDRRAWLKGAAAFGGAALLLPRSGLAEAPAVVTAESERPKIPYSVMSGDPTGGLP
jgi:phosphodiesterase/alkaline phosphatase D-like protein